MRTDLFDRVAVIDVDTHLTEPPDVWTARVPASMREQVPHIERIDGNDVWMAAGERLGHPGYYSMAGWDGVMPVSIPKTFDEIPAGDVRRRRRACASSTSRASTRRCSTRTSAASGTATSCVSATASSCAQCVRAYNDFLIDWCSADPERLLADHRVAVLGRRPRHRRDAARHRARPPRGELLQPAAGPRPAAARAPALGSDLGGGAGGRHLGQLPRRRRFDGHAVRRRRPRWGG